MKICLWSIKGLRSAAGSVCFGFGSRLWAGFWAWLLAWLLLMLESCYSYYGCSTGTSAAPRGALLALCSNVSPSSSVDDNWRIKRGIIFSDVNKKEKNDMPAHLFLDAAYLVCTAYLVSCTLVPFWEVFKVSSHQSVNKKSGFLMIASPSSDSFNFHFVHLKWSSEEKCFVEFVINCGVAVSLLHPQLSQVTVLSVKVTSCVEQSKSSRSLFFLRRLGAISTCTQNINKVKTLLLN